MIPIGTKRGFVVFNNMVKEEDDAWTQKCEIRDMTIGALNSEQNWLDRSKENAKQMTKAFSMASSLFCCCLPFHISKS